MDEVDLLLSSDRKTEGIQEFIIEMSKIDTIIIHTKNIEPGR